MNRKKCCFSCIRCLVLLCTLLLSSNLFSQYKAYTVANKRVDSVSDVHPVPLAFVAEKIKFKKNGGLNEFTKWVYDNMKYPENCKKEGIQGRVMLSFIVTAEGDVTGAKVLRGVHPELDAEALRLVKSSPKWESPGVDVSGRACATRVVFPVIFQLTGAKAFVAGERFASLGDGVYLANSYFLSKMPGFAGGGSNEFLKWIYSNIRYPEQCIGSNVGGRVLVSFVINEDGWLSYPRIMKSSSNRFLDSAALSVVSNSPRWTAGERDGKRVKSRVTIPIVFQPVKAAAQGSDESAFIYSKGTMVSPLFTIGSNSGIYTPNTHNNFTVWVFNNVEYPDEARKEKLQGRVIVSFVVNEKGKVTNVNVVKGCHKVLDEEAVRVIKSSPDWVPARIDDVAVPVTYTFPIVFQLR